MPSDNGVFTVQSNKIIQQMEFEWQWKIENYELKKSYTRKFSLMDGSLIMRFELKTQPHAKFLQSEVVWFFEMIPKSWNKEFHLTVLSNEDSKFYCDTWNFQKMQLNRQYYGQEGRKLTRQNVKCVLNQDNALELTFEMTIRDAEANLQSVNEGLVFDEGIFSKGFKNVLRDGIFSDFEFTVEGEKIPSYKILLASRSEVWNQIFATKDEKKEKEIANITGASKSTLEKFLTYLYTDELDNLNDNIPEFLYLAHTFGISSLKSKCEEILAQQLKDNNAIHIYNHVFRFNLNDELKVKAFKLIQKKFTKLNHTMDNSFIDNPDLVTALLNSYQFLLDGLNKRVKFAESADADGGGEKKVSS